VRAPMGPVKKMAQQSGTRGDTVEKEAWLG
jgi:hypothetical protein